MAKFLTPLINEDLCEPYERFSKIHEPFIVADIKCLKDVNMQDTIEIPAGFCHDYESEGPFRGSCKRGGVVHDWASRIDAMVGMTKALAAKLYFEIMEASDAEKKNQSVVYRFGRWNRRWFKWGVVRIALGYWHKWYVLSTCYEMAEG